ncbi:hypothetical protein WSM22_08340 [Cytophagales bacterium WSM2-2]|nr:hypothetical protein WSM22_08340 [Cytophagales bacterium WSM2-2]
MNIQKYLSLFSVLLLVTISCRDKGLYPLPYEDKTSSAYLRMYSITSNVFDLNDLNNSGFEVIYEPVDEHGGNDLDHIDFYVSHKRGTDLTYETFLKSVDASVFTEVPKPTYSAYKRAKIRITANETLAALQTIVTDPDGSGTTCPKCVPLKGLAAFGATNTFAAGDVINYRWEMVMKDGRKISAANPQTTVDPDYANFLTSNSTANITTGQWYSSPFVYPITVQSLAANTWMGTFTLKQRAIWSPNHTLQVHQESWPSYLSQVLFPDQTVTLTAPSGGLSTEREFTVTYRGSTSKMRINFELTRPGIGSGGFAAIDNAAPTATPPQPRKNCLIDWGFPAGTTDNSAGTSNLGTVYVALQNSSVDCSSERQLYWTLPASGVFGNSPTAATGSNPTASNFLSANLLLPQNMIPNRGTYRWDGTNGLNVGNTFSIAVDDDCDEYGRGNGYCTWTRRVYLTLTKQ